MDHLVDASTILPIVLPELIASIVARPNADDLAPIFRTPSPAVCPPEKTVIADARHYLNRFQRAQIASRLDRRCYCNGGKRNDENTPRFPQHGDLLGNWISSTRGGMNFGGV